MTRKYMNFILGGESHYIEVKNFNAAKELAILLDNEKIAVEIFLLDDDQELDDRDVLFMNNTLINMATEIAQMEVEKTLND